MTTQTGTGYIHNLVFEGGGVKGIAYVGALRELDRRGVLPNIVRVGGTSAGAIVAVLVGLGYTPSEISDNLWSLDFNKLMDDSWGIIRDVSRLVEHFGWYKGDYFQRWIQELILSKTGSRDITFKDLDNLCKVDTKLRSIYLIGTNLSTGLSEVFSSIHTPSMRLSEAVRISMSIPLLFTAVTNNFGDVFTDGGVLDNYPVKIFDWPWYASDANNTVKKGYYASDLYGSTKMVFNKETLGFRLDTRDEISLFRDHMQPSCSRNRINSFVEFIKALVGTLLDAQQNCHLHSDDWARTVYIDTLGARTTQFDISDDMKKALIVSGESGVSTYFNWLESEQRKAATI